MSFLTSPFDTIYHKWFIGDMTTEERQAILNNQILIDERQGGANRDLIDQIQNSINNENTPSTFFTDIVENTKQNASDLLPTFPQVDATLSNVKWILIAALGIYGLTLIAPAAFEISRATAGHVRKYRKSRL